MAQILNIDAIDVDLSEIRKCADLIRDGKLVVFPTETVYGLGANSLDSKAVERIFEAKGRPSDNPLIVHISDREMLDNIVEEVPNEAKKLMRCFWPGPLTIIFKKKDVIPMNVTCNLTTVAVRMPSHPVARHLIKESGVPIAAPSANISGKPSTTIVAHVIDDLRWKVDAIIDSGSSDIGLESTVIDVTGDEPHLLRPGGVTKEQLEMCLGKRVLVDNPTSEKPKSPGMKYKHYSPDAELILASGKDEDEIGLKIEQFSNNLVEQGKKVVILGSEELYNERKDNFNCKFNIICSRTDLTVLAANIFRALRDVDKNNYDYILIGAFPEEGIGLAIMNRLKKAASKIL